MMMTMIAETNINFEADNAFVCVVIFAVVF